MRKKLSDPWNAFSITFAMKGRQLAHVVFIRFRSLSLPWRVGALCRILRQGGSLVQILLQFHHKVENCRSDSTNVNLSLLHFLQSFHCQSMWIIPETLYGCQESHLVISSLREAFQLLCHVTHSLNNFCIGRMSCNKNCQRTSLHTIPIR